MKKEWFENENFWLEYAPIIFDEKRWAEASAVAAATCKIAGLKKGDAVLDAGCGPGRVAVEFALLGMRVTGVDLVKGFLDAARETADDENVALDLRQADLRNFRCEAKFDLAVNLYTSFGYCETANDDIKVLESIAAALKSGGTLVLETLALEVAVRDFCEGEWFERAGKVVLTEYKVEGAWEGLRQKWILLDKTGGRIEHEHVQRLYSAADMKRILPPLGFSSVEVFGDFDLSPYDEKARTMVVVAKKS